MLLTEIFQLPQSYNMIELLIFNQDDSIEIINIYNSMYNDNLSKEEKIRYIKKAMDMMLKCHTESGKKFFCLVIFSILNTPFGYKIIQENERFRRTVNDKYNQFIDIDDQDFTEALRIRKI